jgi:hypothetical protein
LAGLDVTKDILEQTQLPRRNRNVVAEVFPCEDCLGSNLQTGASIGAAFLFAISLVSLVSKLLIQFFELVVFFCEVCDGSPTSAPFDVFAEEGVLKKLVMYRWFLRGDHTAIKNPTMRTTIIPQFRQRCLGSYEKACSI